MVRKEIGQEMERRGFISEMMSNCQYKICPGTPISFLFLNKSITKNIFFILLKKHVFGKIAPFWV